MSSDFPRMVYQAGGTEEIHGSRFSTLIVRDESELDAALAGGWHMTTEEARDTAAPKKAATEIHDDARDDSAPPTRAELEQKARELGIEFSPRLGDAKLAERIADRLKEQA